MDRLGLRKVTHLVIQRCDALALPGDARVVFLDADSCAVLGSGDNLPTAARVGLDFIDPGYTVTVNIDKGLPSRGIAQCAVWAGDGSHRIPMMERANQTPAFDAVRILVG